MHWARGSRSTGSVSIRITMVTLAADGFVITVGHDDHGRVIAEVRAAAGETWQVWSRSAYTGAAEWAQQVGSELDEV